MTSASSYRKHSVRDGGWGRGGWATKLRGQKARPDPALPPDWSHFGLDQTDADGRTCCRRDQSEPARRPSTALLVPPHTQQGCGYTATRMAHRDVGTWVKGGLLLHRRPPTRLLKYCFERGNSQIFRVPYPLVGSEKSLVGRSMRSLFSNRGRPRGISAACYFLYHFSTPAP